jgi:uncharacterized protein (DUF2147 family)
MQKHSTGFLAASRAHLTPMRLLACSVLLASTAAFAAPTAGVRGDWQTTTNSIVQIAPCGAQVCLTVVRLAPTAPETTDRQNPDAALRNRALCGLTVGTGFAQSDPNHLTDGYLYDPRTGHTYRGTITADGNTLHLHGYVGISLFGRSETWHRVATVPACK